MPLQTAPLFNLPNRLPQSDYRNMKAIPVLAIGSLLLLSSLAVSARDSALRYKFTAGHTNVFAIEISVRSETGTECSTGNVFLVTREVSTNSARLSCRGALKVENKRSPQRGPNYFPYYQGNMMQTVNPFPNDSEIELDDRGHELRDGGDYVLPLPLGKLVQSIYAPLPAKTADNEAHDTVTVLDDPFWLGPAESFLNVRMNGQPLTMNYYMGGSQRTVLATLLLPRQTITRMKSAPADFVKWQQQTTLASALKTGADPRLLATSETEVVFDGNAGLIASVETLGDVATQTGTTSRKAKVSFKCRRLTGAELALALAPPPPPAPARKLAGADLEKLVSDLRSPDLDTRRAALRQFNGAEVAAPDTELVELVAAMALDSDSFVRMTAAGFLASYGTTNQIPLLLKLLKDSDWSTRQSATKLLGKLKDERAIQPLVNLLARGGNMSGPDLNTALINFGAPAEKAVLGLFSEKNLETQRQACLILQQIGTGESVAALQRVVGDGDSSLSQAAVEALRAIQQRQ